MTRGTVRGCVWSCGRPGSDEVDRLAFLQPDDGFFPVVGAAGVGAALTAQLAAVVGGADVRHFGAEELLDGALDLQLVGVAVHFEDNLVVGFLEECRLFAEADVFDDLVNIVHGLGLGSGVQAVRLASVSRASPTRMTESARRNCSTLTSDAVTNCAQATLRPAR